MEKCIISELKHFLERDRNRKVHHEGDEIVFGDGLRWRSAS